MKKVVVIGAGIGGMALAALLQKQGDYEVVVVERNTFVGGKAAAYERDGFICDMGVHYCALGKNGPLQSVAQEIGAEVTFIEKKPFMRLQEGDRAFNFSASFKNPMSMLKMWLLSRAHPRDSLGGLRLFLKLLSIKDEKDVEPYDEMPLTDFLDSYLKDQKLKNFLATFCSMLMVLPPEEASAGEFLYCFGGMARSGSLCYPQGSFSAIPKAYQRVFENEGGRLLLKESVEAIRVEENRVIGVELSSGFMAADLVVSNAGIKKTVALAGEKQFSKTYVERVNKLKNSAGAVTLKYALDKCPYNIPLYMYCPEVDNFSDHMKSLGQGIVPENLHMFMPMTTVSDPDLAPPGKHILIAGSMIPEELDNKELGEAVLDNMEATLGRLFPGFEEHVIWKHRTNLEYTNGLSGRGTGDVIGLAQTYYQVGKNKPDPRTPVDGLWLVGCDAGGRGVGTEQAADSALKVSKMIMDD